MTVGVVRRGALCALALGMLIGVARPVSAAPRTWSAAWGTAVATQAFDDTRSAATFLGPDIREQSIRMVTRTGLAGSAVRVRLSNIEGHHPVTIVRASVGALNAGKGIRAGTLRSLAVGGRRSFTIGAGQTVTTDAADLAVSSGEDLAVTLHVAHARGPFSGHEESKRVTWISPPGSGDWSHDETGAGFEWATTTWYWLDRLDVLTDRRPVIVAIGDSITDGHGALPEQHQDWPARLADRLHGSAAVINAGINANTVTRTGCGPCGRAMVDRLHRDVLTVPGITHLVVFGGTNDITQGVPAARITAGLADIVRRARARGITVIGATITPRDDRLFGWNPAVHGPVRRAVNHWIRTSRTFDAVIDFDVALRDPASPEFLNLQYDSGDRLHPNAPGMAALANAVDLRLVGR